MATTGPAVVAGAVHVGPRSRERRIRDVPLFEHRAELHALRGAGAAGAARMSTGSSGCSGRHTAHSLADQAGRVVVKGARGPLLRDRAGLPELWHHSEPQRALRAWRRWYDKATHSGIALLMRFAQRLCPYLSGILDHCRRSIWTIAIQVINSQINVIKHMAYGFRDDAYSFPEVRAAFPGAGR